MVHTWVDVGIWTKSKGMFDTVWVYDIGLFKNARVRLCVQLRTFAAIVEIFDYYTSYRSSNWFAKRIERC